MAKNNFLILAEKRKLFLLKVDNIKTFLYLYIKIKPEKHVFGGIIT